MCVGAGGISSAIGSEARGGEADGSATALTFLGRHLGRLTARAGAWDVWDGDAGSVGVDAGSSVVRAAGADSCWAILAAKASSTSLASSADRWFLAFRMAIARGCRSSFDRVSISRI